MGYKDNVTVIGALPDPKGGVSVHVARLVHFLKMKGFDVRVVNEGKMENSAAINLRKLPLFQYVKALWWANYVHIHTSNVWVRLFHIASARLLRKQVLVTVHSSRETGLRFLVAKIAVRIASHRIYVSEAVAKRVGAKGHVIPAFLPPLEEELKISPGVAAWMALQRAKGKRLVVSSAYKLAMHEGLDLYGLDMMIDAFAAPEIATEFSCLFIVASAAGREGYLEECREKIRRMNLEDIFSIVEISENFVGVSFHADIVVRATNTDGDSVSVREALHLGRAVIVSDCVERPAGSILFRTRDVTDLRRALVSVVNPPKMPEERHAHSILDFYEELSGRA